MTIQEAIEAGRLSREDDQGWSTEDFYNSDGFNYDLFWEAVSDASHAKAVRHTAFGLLEEIKSRAAHVENNTGPPSGVWIIDDEALLEIESMLQSLNIERPE